MKFSTVIVRKTANYHLVCEGENFNVRYDGTQVKFAHTGAFTYSMERVPHPIPMNLCPVFELENRKRKHQEIQETPREPFVFIPTLF
jgi:hypothetical protein